MNPRNDQHHNGLMGPRARRGLGDLVADDTGASTAEYAIVTMAAVAFASVR